MPETQEPFVGEDGIAAAAAFDGLVEQSTWSIVSAGKVVLTLHPDGRISAPTDMAADNAARAVLDTLLKLNWRRPWRPIETAPKHTSILIAIAGTEEVSAATFDGKVFWVDEASTDRGTVHEIQNPTHYMPLPAPPDAT